MLADNLKKSRKSKGYSQDEVASKLNITRQALSKWENGHSYPDIISLKLLCELYGISIDEMVGNDCHVETKKISNTDVFNEKESFWNTEEIFYNNDCGNIMFNSVFGSSCLIVLTYSS